MGTVQPEQASPAGHQLVLCEPSEGELPRVETSTSGPLQGKFLSQNENVPLQKKQASMPTPPPFIIIPTDHLHNSFFLCY